MFIVIDNGVTSRIVAKGSQTDGTGFESND